MNKNRYIGLAGEYRVMTKLLLLEQNPAQSCLDNGVDIYLRNKKLQVKTASLRNDGARTKRYAFNLEKGKYGFHSKKYIGEEVDFLVLWCIDDDAFYIIPRSEVINRKNILIVISKERNRKSWYDEYQNKWELLL